MLTDAEIRRFWEALNHAPLAISAAFRLRLITAQRGVEVHNMRWTDIDWDNRWWTVPASDAKNGLPHRVPLNDLAIDILTGLRDRMDGDASTSIYVLASARGPKRRAAVSNRLGLDDFPRS